MRRLYICLYGLLLLASTQVLAITPLRTVNLTDKPVGFILSKDESKAYVAIGDPINQSGGEVDVIDVNSLKITGRIKVPGCPWPYLFLSKNNQKLYLIYHNTIAIADLNTDQIISQITLPKNHYIQPGAVISPDHGKIYYNISPQWTNEDSYLLIVDTETDKVIGRLNNKAATTDGDNVQINLASLLMFPKGNRILEIPQPLEGKKQRLMSLNTENGKSDLLGYLPAISILGQDAVVMTQDEQTIYTVGYDSPQPDQPVSSFHLYAIDRQTMQTKEIYFSESAMGILGLSEAKHRLYMLHAAWDHKRMAVIDTQTGYVIKNNIPMPSMDIKISTQADSANVYYTAERINGTPGTFNIMTVE